MFWKKTKEEETITATLREWETMCEKYLENENELLERSSKIFDVSHDTNFGELHDITLFLSSELLPAVTTVTVLYPKIILVLDLAISIIEAHHAAAQSQNLPVDKSKKMLASLIEISKQNKEIIKEIFDKDGNIKA